MGNRFTCKVCNANLPPGFLVTCPPPKTCREIRQKAQLAKFVANRSAKRKAEAAGRIKVCEICKQQFAAVSKVQIYCDKEACKAEGLKRAIERQRQKREQAKAKKKAEKEALAKKKEPINEAV